MDIVKSRSPFYVLVKIITIAMDVKFDAHFYTQSSSPFLKSKFVFEQMEPQNSLHTNAARLEDLNFPLPVPSRVLLTYEHFFL